MTACSESACFHWSFCEWAHTRYHAEGSHSQDQLSARIKARSDDAILSTGALYVHCDAGCKIRRAVCLLANILSSAWLNCFASLLFIYRAGRRCMQSMACLRTQVSMSLLSAGRNLSPGLQLADPLLLEYGWHEVLCIVALDAPVAG